MRRAIQRSLQLIVSCNQDIDESESFAARRPIRATRQLMRVLYRIDDVVEQLDRASARLRSTISRASECPELALDAPDKVIEATAQWVGAVGQFAVLSNRLRVTLSSLRESVVSGAIPVPIEEQTANPEREPIVIIRRVSTRCLPPELLLLDKYLRLCVPTRRRSPVSTAIAEAARRIFRGRAPPRFPACSL